MLRLGLPLGVGSAGALVEAILFLTILGFAWPIRGGRQCWKTGAFPQMGNRRPSPRRVLWAKVCEMEGGPRLNQGFINELTNLLYIASSFPFYRALLATSSWYKFAL